MNVQIAPAPVRKSILVNAAPERAFEVFTAGMTRWWDPAHHLGKTALKAVVLESRVGGRWYEIGEDGSECEWGKVLAFEPPSRLLLAWQIDSHWQYDPEFLTELEVRFIPEDGGTRVELEHRNLDRFGAAAPEVRAAFDAPDGWMGGLERLRAVLDEAG